MGGRFLDKRFTIQDGFSKGQGDDSPAMFFDGDTLTVNRGAAIEGNLTATAITLNTVTAGSGAITNLRVGSSAGNNLITAVWKTTYTWNVGAIAGIYGSLSGVTSVDVAMSGATVGDVIVVSPIGSYDLGVSFFGACYSAGAVSLRAQCISTLANTVGNVPLKIVDIKI